MISKEDPDTFSSAHQNGKGRIMITLTLPAEALANMRSVSYAVGGLSVEQLIEDQVRVTVDTRDPWPHPWAKFLPEGWELVGESLDTEDVVLSALPEGAVIERKTASDMVSCIGVSRERFEGAPARALCGPHDRCA
jgi:ERCC4-type nuclease